MKHAAKIHIIIPMEYIDCSKHIKRETNGQFDGHGNIYSQSSYLTSQEQQKPVGSSRTSKAINVPIQAPGAN